MPPSYFAFIVCGAGAGAAFFASVGVLVWITRGRCAHTAAAITSVNKTIAVNFIR
jgi:hypothetical protein